MLRVSRVHLTGDLIGDLSRSHSARPCCSCPDSNMRLLFCSARHCQVSLSSGEETHRQGPWISKRPREPRASAADTRSLVSRLLHGNSSGDLPHFAPTNQYHSCTTINAPRRLSNALLFVDWRSGLFHQAELKRFVSILTRHRLNYTFYITFL